MNGCPFWFVFGQTKMNGKIIKKIMKDEACIRFLQWALPQLHLRWPGFRKVRGQVCKRLGRRLAELQLADLNTYRMYLENNHAEWQFLDTLCRITISRFFRDRGTFEALQTLVLPELAGNLHRRKEENLTCWCIGAASGEEPYSVSLLWSLSGLASYNLDCKILATEVDLRMINRALEGCYSGSSIRELPEEVRMQAFTPKKGLFCLKDKFKNRVQFLQQDIRYDLPNSSFDIIFCRNLVFTYFSDDLQVKLTSRILQRLKPGGAIILGAHEKLPGAVGGLAPWSRDQKKILRRVE